MSSADDQWRKILVTGHRPLVVSRHVWRHVPSAPRCKVCGNPFGGVGGRIDAWPAIPTIAEEPQPLPAVLRRAAAGRGRGRHRCPLRRCARLDRGSASARARATTPRLLNRFYAVATDVLLRHDALIDKLIGDEAMALFIPGVGGPRLPPARRSTAAYRHPARASATARLRGRGWTVGVGVNAGAGVRRQRRGGGRGLHRAGRRRQRRRAPAGAGGRRGGRGRRRRAPGHRRPAARASRRTLQVRGHETPVPVLVAGV